MENEAILGKQLTFNVPSGHEVTICEQNGEHDDILSHPGDARTLMNISKFISALVVNCNYNKEGKLTPEEAHLLPVLDRYCILINSRIHSLGLNLEMKYEWPIEAGGPQEYSVELTDFLLSDYKAPATQLDEELKMKPEAIPYYPAKDSQLAFELESGKQIKFSILTGASESRLLNLPDNEKTKNSELLVRDLELMVDGKYVKVQRFHLFNPREMAEMRQLVKRFDPAFFGKTLVENPNTGQNVWVNIMAMTDFFYLGEM